MSENENNPFDSSQASFGLPGGYFQRSAGTIFNKIEWQEEHKDYPQLLKYKEHSGFRVPASYFEKNEQQLELVETPVLAGISKQQPFSAPATYFEEVEITLLSRALQDNNELQGFERLNAISRKNPYKVHKEYFKEQAQQTTELLETQKHAKIRSLFTARTWYAAAALLVVALGLWTYNSYNRSVAAVDEDCGTIACIDRVDLVKSKSLESLDNDELYEIVDTKKLEQQLNAGTTVPKETKTDSSQEDEPLDDVTDGI